MRLNVSNAAELQNEIIRDGIIKFTNSLEKNMNLSREIIKYLQNDQEPEVSTEAKKLKTGFLKSLFG